MYSLQTNVAVHPNCFAKNEEGNFSTRVYIGEALQYDAAIGKNKTSHC
jgi:hypothetical protein